jgi:hypothetical protein
LLIINQKMNDNARVEACAKLTRELGLAVEHEKSIEDVEDYFLKHRINELFNELMTNVLQERPENATAYIL